MQSFIYEWLSKDTEHAAESLSVMMQKEQEVYSSCDYLHLHHLSLPEVTGILLTGSDRLKIVDWCYGVIDQCKFDRETVAIAMDMVDRFLSKPSPVAHDALQDRNLFHLIAIGALYIAIKTNEKLTIGSDFFAHMSSGTHSVEEIELMEMIILNGLSWRICAPTSVQMAHCIFSLLLPHVDIRVKQWGFILDEVRFLTEHAVRDYYLSTLRQSTVAMAAILNALDQVNQKDREDLLHALVLVVDQSFDSPEQLTLAKRIMKDLVEGNVYMDDDDEATVVSEVSSNSSDTAHYQQYEASEIHGKL